MIHPTFFPIWCNANFGSIFFAFCIVYGSENRLKINITSYGEYFISYGGKIYNLEGYIFMDFFLPLRKYRMDFQFSGINGNIELRCTWDELGKNE